MVVNFRVFFMLKNHFLGTKKSKVQKRINSFYGRRKRTKKDKTRLLENQLKNSPRKCKNGFVCPSILYKVAF